MGRETAIEMLLDAHDRFAQALKRTPMLVLDQRSWKALDSESLYEVMASAEAQLCAGCALLDVPPPPAELLPGFESADEGYPSSPLSLWRLLVQTVGILRVRRWLRRRLRLVRRLLDLDVRRKDLGGPYR